MECNDTNMSEKKLKVALLLPSLEATGPIIFTQYLIRELKNKVAYIEVFYFKEAKKIDLGVKCTKISFWEKKSFENFDLVHSTMAVPDLYAAMHVKAEKWISSMHNYLEQDVKMLSKPMKALAVITLWKWALSKCKNIIVSSRAMMDYYLDLLGEKNYMIIPYGINGHKYEPVDFTDQKILENLKQAGYTVVGSVGNFIRRKGFIQLADVLEKNDRLALVIIGDGPERAVMSELCDKKGLSDRVYFPGFRSDSYNYYQYLDVYAHVSYSEGFGLAMLEAMEKKLPVVCSKLDIYEEYFTDNDVCYFAPGDQKSLCRAFEKVLENLEHYGNASYKLYENKFNLDKMAKLHIEYYNAALEKQ